MTADTQSEQERMARTPGIVFADGAAGRRARIAGTGIDVWEVAAVYRSGDDDLEHLARWFDSLNPKQLQTALAYYTLYPQEIDAEVEANDKWLEALEQNGPWNAAAHQRR